MQSLQVFPNTLQEVAFKRLMLCEFQFALRSESGLAVLPKTSTTQQQSLRCEAQAPNSSSLCPPETPCPTRLEPAGGDGSCRRHGPHYEPAIARPVHEEASARTIIASLIQGQKRRPCILPRKSEVSKTLNENYRSKSLTRSYTCALPGFTHVELGPCEFDLLSRRH